MKMLILGGTLFLGRALVDAALARSHGVTIFHRGRQSRAPIAGVETLLGDRDGQLDALHGREWDVVVDTSGYVPRLVRASADLLAGSVRRYVFVSSISVYADFSRPIPEDAPLATMPNERQEEVTGATYGPLKVLCEQAVSKALPGRALIVRPGLIVGPNDPTNRFTYWTGRVARGGEILAPGAPEAPVQFIDARDLAEWMVRMMESEQVGTFNATGPDHVLTMAHFLDACRTASGSDARFTWVSEDFLAEQGVAPWSELPLYLPSSPGTHEYFSRTDVGPALTAGLAFRPLAQTIGDTLAWQRGTAGEPLPDKPGVPMPDVALTPQRERALLDAWHGRGGADQA
jgi:2'-hydroxyisoflavone reductase